MFRVPIWPTGEKGADVFLYVTAWKINLSLFCRREQTGIDSVVAMTMEVRATISFSLVLLIGSSSASAEPCDTCRC